MGKNIASKVQKVNKRKTSDPTMYKDVTYENYLALLTAILIDESHPNYKALVYNKTLFDKEEERRRIEEIDRIRSVGGKTELQVWYYNSVNGYSESTRGRELIKTLENRTEKGRQLIQRALIKKHNKREEIKRRIQFLYNGELIDVKQMDYREIIKFKIKAINIETGEIKIFNNKDICSKEMGIAKRNIITYMRNQSIFKGKYVFTISYEKVDEQSVKTRSIKIRAININNGETMDFKDIRSASEYFNMNYVTFQQKITYKKDKRIGEWEIRRVR